MHLKLIWRVPFWVLCLLIAVASWRFIALGVPMTMPAVANHLEPRAVALYMHIGLAPVALALLPFQFSLGFRRKHPLAHRWMGRVSGVAILLAAVSGFIIGWTSAAGPVAALGFCLLAVLWIVTTVIAVRAALQRDFSTHRDWMIRSGALTFAAVTLRVYLPFLAMMFGFETGYLIVSWLAWVPNLALAEWFIRRGAVGGGLPA